jgi:ketosteroid isomerase-like protein
MRKLLILSFIFFHSKGNAQQINEVINAENSFAGYAKEYNTKDAFLNFCDSNGVVFNQGKAINAKKVFSRSKPATDKLLWQPAFAGIASSGELGFSTGPFEKRPSLTDTITYGGAFSTIWRKTEDGQWKFLVDLGVVLGNSPMAVQQVKKATVSKKATTKGIDDVKSMDAQFISAYKENAKKAYANYLHRDACLNLKNAILLLGEKQWTEAIHTIPSGLEMTPMEAGISKAGDLAYVYGLVTFEGKNENYLRVWQNTANGWKIILQTLNW